LSIWGIRVSNGEALKISNCLRRLRQVFEI